MTTLIVGTTTDFTHAALSGINQIEFVNPADTVAHAVFYASQFGGVAIAANVGISGNDGINSIIVYGGNLDASGWTFTSWSSADLITLNGASLDDTITGSPEPEKVASGAGDDTLDGGYGADIVKAQGGNDTIVARDGQGSDSIDGGKGTDFLLIDRSSAITPLSIDITDGGGGRDIGDGTTIASMERIDFTGGSGSDVITGGALADLLSGRGGDDTLTGGSGIDRLKGGGGHDTFHLAATIADHDLVRGFSTSVDSLEIAAAEFGGGLAAGALNPAQFVSNTTGLAGDSDDLFIYDTVTGELFFDSDCSGGGSGQLVAVLTGAPLLSSADFTII